MNPDKSKETGFALVLAIVVVTLLSVAGLELSREVRLSLALASNFQDRTKARMKALDGLTLAAHALSGDDPAYDSLDEDWASLGETLEEPEKKEKNQEPDPVKAGLELSLEDLGGRLNLNLLVDQKGQANAMWVGVFSRLLEITGHSPDLLSTLQDWLDKDSETRTGGAEAADYKTLGRKTGPRNGRLLDIDELGLVRGFGKAVMQGAEDKTGLAGLVAVTGNTKINVNTAPIEILRSLDTGLSEGLAKAIVELREERPIRKLTEIRGLVGMSPDLYRAVSPMLDIKSAWFAAASRGSSGRARYRIKAVFKRDKKEIKLVEARIE